MILTEDMKAWLADHQEDLKQLIRDLCAIPAPSHHEELRVEFTRYWQASKGAQSVILDAAKNVILPLGDSTRPMLAVMAHTDVVFPDTSPLPVRDEEGILYAPGVSDDTANVAALMFCAKFFLTRPDLIPEPLLIVFNSC